MGKIWFSRSGVRLYAATPRSGPGLLCAAARFVSATYVTVLVLSRICRPQKELLSAGRVEFTPAASATTKGDIYVPGIITVTYMADTKLAAAHRRPGPERGVAAYRRTPERENHILPKPSTNFRTG